MSLDLLPMELHLLTPLGRTLGVHRTKIRFNDRLETLDGLVAEAVGQAAPGPLEIAYQFGGRTLDKRKPLYSFFPMFKDEYERTNCLKVDALVPLTEEPSDWQTGSGESEPPGVPRPPYALRDLATPSPPKQLKKKNKKEASDFECRTLHFLSKNFRCLWRELLALVSGSTYETTEGQALFKTLQVLAAFAISIEQTPYAEYLLTELVQIAPPQAQLGFQATLCLLARERSPGYPLLTHLEQLSQIPKDTKAGFCVLFFIGIRRMEESESCRRFDSILKISKQLRKLIDPEWQESNFFLSEAYFYAALASYRQGKTDKAFKYAKMALKARLKNAGGPKESTFKFFELLTWVAVEGKQKGDLMSNYEKLAQKEIELFQNTFCLEFFERWANFRTLQLKIGDPKASSWTETEDSVLDSLKSTFHQVLPLKYLLPLSFISISKILIRFLLRRSAIQLRRGKLESVPVLLKDLSFIFGAQASLPLDLFLLKSDYKIMKACVYPQKTARARQFVAEVLGKARETWGSEDANVKKLMRNLSAFDEH